MPLPQTSKENLTKAYESPNIGKRGKGKKTLLAQELRRIFIEKVAERWEAIVDAQIKDALVDRRAREFLINHAAGKPKEKQEVEINRPLAFTEKYLNKD